MYAWGHLCSCKCVCLYERTGLAICVCTCREGFLFLCTVEGGACVQALIHVCVCTHTCTHACACLSVRACVLGATTAAEGEPPRVCRPGHPKLSLGERTREGQNRERQTEGSSRAAGPQARRCPRSPLHGPGEGLGIPPPRGWLQPWDRVGTEPLPAPCSPPLRCLVTSRSATCPIGLTLEGFMKNIDLA